MGAFTSGTFPATQSTVGTARRLLIIEDDEDFADSLVSILQPRGLELQVVRDAAQVSSVLDAFSAEVALVDVRLGRYSGLDVVAELKTRKQPILTVIMTAYVAAETAIEALRRGAYDYLTKPFEPGELLATLERCFDRIDVEKARVNAEAARRKSQARLRALIDNALDLIAVIDPTSRFARFVSPSVTRLLGYPVDSAIPTDFLDYVHPEDRERAQQILQDCAQNEGSAHTVELRFRHTDGSWRWFEVAARGLLREPAIAGVLIGARDVTERRAMEEKLRQVQRMEAVGQLTGGVAHDFNNLLAVIIGNLDLLRRELRSNPAQMQLVEGGMHAAERGATLIRRLLAFARRQTLTPRALDLNELIRNAIEILRRAAGPSIQIEADLAPDLAACIADTAQLETALLNLVINGRDAMPDGGRIQIATRNVQLQGETEVEDGAGDPYVRVSVTDSGSGIDEEIRGRVFEPFFSTKAPGQGTGLGLSMVFGFVEQSNGRIRLVTQVGKGTTFFLYFPRSDQAAVHPRQRPIDSSPPRSRNEAILLVEDDVEVRQMLQRLLGELGYQVTTASTGSEALGLLENGLRPDLLLTDVVLPDGPNGFELAAQARTRQPRLKLLFTSGYAQGLASRKPPSLAGSFLLQKPFHRSELAHLVRRALDAPAGEGRP
jgi:PAS domain S-box-containing protein